MKRSCLGFLGGLALLLTGLPAPADEGMWLLNAPPRDRLLRDYRFELKQDWLDHLMRSCVRFDNGGSGAFVSREGLVVTNHHIGSDSLQKLSTPGHDLVQQGFYAPTQAAEKRCPDLELNVLQSIEDVTHKIEAAVSPSMTTEQASASRRAAMSNLEKEEANRTGLRCDIVTLYQGGAYHLYRYKKYTDVRLVMAPHKGVAFFGGDHDNFEFPRYNFDVCFFRVYEHGQPLNSPDYLPWSAKGVHEGDLVFVMGHPGRTNRLDTYARLLHLRSETLPYRIQVLSRWYDTLAKFSAQGKEQARLANHSKFSISNSLKAYRGQLQGLQDEALMAEKKRLEDELRFKVQVSPEWRAKAASAWDNVAEAEHKLSAFEKDFFMIEGRQAVHSDLFTLARHLVRLSTERNKVNANRLREYRESNMASLNLELFSPAPISAELEKVQLASSLEQAREILGATHPTVVKLLDGKEPQARAAELVDGCGLIPVERRKALSKMTYEELRRSGDKMIELAMAVDPDALQLRHRYELEVEEPERQAYALIARSQFALDANAHSPDATFTLRLAYGRVLSYNESPEKKIRYFTSLRDMYDEAELKHNEEPYRLPDNWLAAKGKLPLDQPFNFVSTADTIGGNSGSPVVNQRGELVGVNFDRNRFGLVRNFLYSEKQARHIAVHSPATLELLTTVYQCPALVHELTQGHR